MGLIESLQNFADNLPHAIDGLKDLREDFKKTFGPLAREGAELFTVGYHEMVIKENSAWKTSYEHLESARRLFAEARAASPLSARRLAAEEALGSALEKLAVELGESRDALLELEGLLEIETLLEDEATEPEESETEDGAKIHCCGGKPDGFFGALLHCADHFGGAQVGIAAAEAGARLMELSYRKVLAQKGIDAPCRIDYTSESAFACTEMAAVNACTRRECEAVQAFAGDAGQVEALLRAEIESFERLLNACTIASARIAAIRQRLMAWADRVELAIANDNTADTCRPGERERMTATVALIRACFAEIVLMPATPGNQSALRREAAENRSGDYR